MRKREPADLLNIMASPSLNTPIYFRELFQHRHAQATVWSTSLIVRGPGPLSRGHLPPLWQLLAAEGGLHMMMPIQVRTRTQQHAQLQAHFLSLTQESTLLTWKPLTKLNTEQGINAGSCRRWCSLTQGGLRAAQPECLLWQRLPASIMCTMTTAELTGRGFTSLSMHCYQPSPFINSSCYAQSCTNSAPAQLARLLRRIAPAASPGKAQKVLRPLSVHSGVSSVWVNTCKTPRPPNSFSEGCALLLAFALLLAQLPLAATADCQRTCCGTPIGVVRLARALQRAHMISEDCPGCLH